MLAGGNRDVRVMAEAESPVETPVAPVRLEPHPHGGALRGGRLCLLGGRRGTVVRFRVDGESVSYYVMAEGTGGAERLDAAAFREETDAGYNVVAWRRGGLIHALVGALPRERLTILARIYREQLAATLPGTARRP